MDVIDSITNHSTSNYLTNDQLRRKFLAQIGYTPDEIERISQELELPRDTATPAVPETDPVPPPPPPAVPECTLTMNDIQPLIEQVKIEKQKTKARKALVQQRKPKQHQIINRTTPVNRSPGSLHSIEHQLTQASFIGDSHVET